MNLNRVGTFLAIFALLVTPATSFAAMLTALATFGNGDGFRAPNEIVVGDTPGTDTITPGSYDYLKTGSLERGLAYNSVTDNLILVSRSTAGNGIRKLNGQTGADSGALNQGTGVITGGTFTTNMVGVASDGAIYVGNLQTNVTTGAFKVYRWANEAATIDASPFFNSTIAGYGGTPRHGDSLDVTGSGAGTAIVAGASGVIGYSIITSSGGTAVPSFTPAGPAAGDFRLGVTFAATASDVWGKQTGGTSIRETSYSGSTGTYNGAAAVSTGEAAMDYAVINGVPLLAVANMNTGGGAPLPTIQVYDMTNPLLPVLLVTGSTASGTQASNGNGTGAVAWGKSLSGTSAVLYAMVSNQGIQAFTFDLVPEPSSVALMLLGGCATAFFGRRRDSF